MGINLRRGALDIGNLLAIVNLANSFENDLVFCGEPAGDRENVLELVADRDFSLVATPSLSTTKTYRFCSTSNVARCGITRARFSTLLISTVPFGHSAAD